MFSTSCKNPDFVAINAQFVKSPLITAAVPSAGRICCSSFSITVWFTDTGRKKMSGNGGWKFVSLFFLIGGWLVSVLVVMVVGATPSPALRSLPTYLSGRREALACARVWRGLRGRWWFVRGLWTTTHRQHQSISHHAHTPPNAHTHWMCAGVVCKARGLVCVGLIFVKLCHFFDFRLGET